MSTTTRIGKTKTTTQAPSVNFVTARMSTITAERLTPTVGALVQGVYRERLLSDEALPGWTLEALDAHGALVFRGLHMTDDDQVAFSKLLGTVEVFGTGAHPTTRLCLELILDAAVLQSFVDLGCGSGVLAIVAAKLGWPAVTALDYDKAATTATRENAGRNRVELEVVDFDLRHEQVPDADLVAANVLAAPLVGWAASQRRLAPRLILSGLLASEADRVAAAFAQRGRHEHARRVSGEWAALALSETVP